MEYIASTWLVGPTHHSSDEQLLCSSKRPCTSQSIPFCLGNPFSCSQRHFEAAFLIIIKNIAVYYMRIGCIILCKCFWIVCSWEITVLNSHFKSLSCLYAVRSKLNEQLITSRGNGFGNGVSTMLIINRSWIGTNSVSYRKPVIATYLQ